MIKVVPTPRPLLTKRTDVLPRGLVKPRSRETRVKTFAIALTIEMVLGSSAADMPVKLQSVTIILRHNLATSSLHGI